MDLGIFLLCVLVSYLLGAISFSRVVAHLLAPKLDLEEVKLPNADGSDGDSKLLNVGATTASIKLGPQVGCVIGLLDILKAFVPTLVFRHLYPGQYYYLVASLFAVVGHNWPVYYRFKGGNGMSPTLGGFLVVDWIGTLVANILGMFFGFVVLRDIFFAYVGWTWFMIPWLWIRTGNPVFALYALAVNLIFLLALLPEIRRYLEARRLGKLDMQQGMEVTPMGRGMLKIAKFFRVRIK
jgi:glycerol-3-phosphate acyltransferase PlsY